MKITDVRDVLMQLVNKCHPGAGIGLELDHFFPSLSCSVTLGNPATYSQPVGAVVEITFIISFVYPEL